jgi:hypothetical protein
LPDLFRVLPYDDYDKRVNVEGPDDLLFEVDTDDVDKDAVVGMTHKLVAVLNDNWHTYPDGP